MRHYSLVQRPVGEEEEGTIKLQVLQSGRSPKTLLARLPRTRVKQQGVFPPYEKKLTIRPKNGRFWQCFPEPMKRTVSKELRHGFYREFFGYFFDL